MEILKGNGCFGCVNDICNFRQTKCRRWKSGFYKIISQSDGSTTLVKDCHVESNRR